MRLHLLSPLVEGCEAPLLCRLPVYRGKARDEGRSNADERGPAPMNYSGSGAALDAGTAVCAAFITIARKV